MASSKARAQHRAGFLFSESAEARAKRLANDVDTHLGRGMLDGPGDGLDMLLDRAEWRGFEFYLLHTSTFQLGSQGDRANPTWNHSHNLFLDWHAVDDPVWGRGTLQTYFLQDTEYLTSGNADFAQSMGTTILSNDNSGDSFTSLSGFWWQQILLDGQLDITFGQLDPTLLFDINDYAGWDKEYFLAQPLAGNPVRVFPNSGLGVFVEVLPTDWLQMAVAVMDGDGDGGYPDFQSAFDGNNAYFGEIWLTPEVPGLGAGAYRFAVNSIDRSREGPSSTVFLLSFQQDIGDELALFLRFGSGDGRRSEVRQMLSSGVVFKGPFGWCDDVAGLGVIWSDPANGRLRDEYGVELFWRMQLTERMRMSPDVQILFDPANGRRDIGVVGGLRVAVEL